MHEFCSNMIWKQTACPSNSRRSTEKPHQKDDCQTVHPLPAVESERHQDMKVRISENVMGHETHLKEQGLDLLRCSTHMYCICNLYIQKT